MSLHIKATITELGAIFPVVENLHNVSEKKVYDRHCRIITAFLISLHKLRGNTVPKDAVNWKYTYRSSFYHVDTKEYMMEFLLHSDMDRRMQEDREEL